MSSAQYDFCSGIPLWSAVGGHASGGDRLNQAYQEFLDVIVASTDDPDLREGDGRGDRRIHPDAGRDEGGRGFPSRWRVIPGAPSRAWSRLSNPPASSRSVVR
jgi:hypothetical protein